MYKYFKYLLIVFISFFTFRTYEVSAINYDKACGIKFNDIYQVIIKFETNDGERINDLYYCKNCGTAGFKLPIPVRKGYKFVGWYADRDLTIKLDETYIKEKAEQQVSFFPYSMGCDVNKVYTYLYAKWEKIDSCEIPESYNVTLKYVTNSDEKIEDLKFKVGEDNKEISLPIPKKEGYYFIGWYGDSNYTKLIKNEMMTPEDIYKNVNSYYIDNKDCSFEREGKLYAKFVSEEDLIYLVVDAVDNNLFMINDLVM